MTTAQPQHVRAGGGLGRGWRGFRRWRGSRPFWGGLFTVLAGVEMFASTRMTLNGLSFQSGATGLYSLLIPIILLTCGLLLWLSPGQRLFYSIVAAVTTIYSLMGLNLGGFFLGLLLGLVGSALGFAWTPTHRPAPARAGTPPDTVDTSPDTAGSGTAAGSGAGHPGPDGTDAGTDAGRPTLADELMPADGGHPPDAAYREGPAAARDPRYLAVALVVLGLTAGGLVAARPEPVRAAPPPAATACPSTPPTKTASPRPSASHTVAPSATPSADPAPTATAGGNILTDLLHGIGDLLTGGGKNEPSAAPSPSASATPGPKATPTARPTPTATRSGATCTPGRPTRPGTVRPGRLLPRIAPEPGQPRVARRPSKLTGSTVTMTGLRFEGIVDLPTSDGPLEALKFSMDKAVTADFTLVADGPAGRHQQYVTDELTVQGDVAFYATRFVGRLLGIKITLTPDLPFPDGIPITSPIPITFTDPAIDLAFVDSDTLTAKPSLALSVP
ncbi:DUF6114 domain-containing protein [Micromonospora sp. NPDC092111]|uniref:DUF6114 domain-containing protein n=1 Tax=Micromonospora sp. NPDC092111 TaxID=3364289 RepID=UPI0038290255